ncbi:MAG: hypothetical protein ACI39R_04110 [Lachnospiraceae bacterium]
MENNELPLGFSLALAGNPDAMERFAGLSDEKKQEIINGTHAVSSKSEMQQYVENILKLY